MNINLFGSNTTFGMAHSSPPESFTKGKTSVPFTHAIRGSVIVTPVPEKKAYFADLVEASCPFNEDYRCYEDYPYTEIMRQGLVGMVSPDPDLRFMPVEIFDCREQIPLQSLADRNIAVMVNDKQCLSLGDIGRENRRQSFYHPDKTPIHPDLTEENIDRLAAAGFFSAPRDECFIGTVDIPYPVINVSFPCYHKKFMNHRDLTEFINNAPKKEHGLQNELLVYPVIDINHSAHYANVSSVLSPLCNNFVMLIRPSDIKLPMLQGAEAIEEKYRAFIHQAAHSPACIENSEFARMLREAEFFQAPYKTAMEFCELSIRELRSYKEGQELTSLPIIDNAIDKLAFSKKYMARIAALIRKAMLYDDLLLLKQSDDSRVALLNKQKENNTQLMEQELYFSGQAENLGFLSSSGKSFLFPLLYLHSLIMTSLGDILMAGQGQCTEKEFLDNIAVLKNQAEDICIEVDEVLSSKETLCSLKQKNTFV